MKLVIYCVVFAFLFLGVNTSVSAAPMKCWYGSIQAYLSCPASSQLSNNKYTGEFGGKNDPSPASVNSNNSGGNSSGGHTGGGSGGNGGGGSGGGKVDHDSNGDSHSNDHTGDKGHGSGGENK